MIRISNQPDGHTTDQDKTVANFIGGPLYEVAFARHACISISSCEIWKKKKEAIMIVEYKKCGSPPRRLYLLALHFFGGNVELSQQPVLLHLRTVL